MSFWRVGVISADEQEQWGLTFISVVVHSAMFISCIKLTAQGIRSSFPSLSLSGHFKLYTLYTRPPKSLFQYQQILYLRLTMKIRQLGFTFCQDSFFLASHKRPKLSPLPHTLFLLSLLSFAVNEKYNLYFSPYCSSITLGSLLFFVLYDLI